MVHVDRYNRATAPGRLHTTVPESAIVARIRRAMRGGAAALPARYGAAFVARDLPRGEGVGVYALTLRHTVEPSDQWRGATAPVTETAEWCLVTARLLAALEDVPVRLMGSSTHALLRAPHQWPSDPDASVDEVLVTVLISPPAGRPPDDPGAVSILHTRLPTPSGVVGADWDAGDGAPVDVPLVWTTARAPQGWP